MTGSNVATMPRKKKKSVPLTSVSKLPSVPAFGSFQPTAQFGAFNDYMKLIRSALRFAPDWDEGTAADWFDITCGANLRTIISAYDLAPALTSKERLTQLIESLTGHFKSLTDPTLECRAMEDCKQEAGESTNDFFVRLAQLTKYMDVSQARLKTHFVMSLRDEGLKDSAITNDWNLKEIVAAATRRETAKIGRKEIAPTSTGNEVAAVKAVSRGQASSDRFGHRQPGPFQARDGTHRPSGKEHPRDQRARPPQDKKPGCPKCGIFKHNSDVCPATGKTCMNCGELGHFVKVCTKPKVPRGRGNVEMGKRGHVNKVSDDWSD